MKLWKFCILTAALLVYMVMLLKAWITCSWTEDLVELLFGFGGLVFGLFPAEASGFNGHWGWSPSQYRTPPEEYIRYLGLFCLGMAAWSLFSGSTFLDQIFAR